ncbi:MAG: DUF368 domain-containing protein [Lachnospiraceae bacterium]|nr:DUF368 domain-containing protein [Lachnospiraceae bacterium]
MIKNILKGAVIGIANIIPGVSGGTMAVAMGIYDILIHSLTHLFKEFKKSVMTLLPILFGAVIGIVGLSFIIEKMSDLIPMQTNFLFIGLILGSLPVMTVKVKGEKLKFGYIVVCLIFFAIVVIGAVFNSVEGGEADLSMSLFNIVKLFIVGVIASATMVIPGVSGSMMLILMGYYNPIIETVNNFIRSLIAFDMEGIWAGFCVLCPAGIGVVLGIFLVAKLIEIIFEKFQFYAYWAIIGLIAASPFAIVIVSVLKEEFGEITVINILTSVVTLAIGLLISKKLGE